MSWLRGKSDVSAGRSGIVTVLDIGSTKVCCVVGRLKPCEESERLPSGSRDVRLTIGSEGDTLALEVSNRGRALTDEELRMMTMPGYTTKKSGHSGLGLAIVQERVQFYQGALSIRYCPENGTTTIRIGLPRKK